MGLILIPSEVKEKTTTLKSALSNIVSGYQNVVTEINNFATDEALESDSWAKLKEKTLEYHSYISQGMVAVEENISVDLNVLEQSVGDEDLYEDELVRKIKALEIQVGELEESIQFWESFKNLEVKRDITISNLGIDSMITSLKEDLENVKEEIVIYKEKLDFLYTVEDGTKGLFASGEQLLIAMAALIGEVGVKIMSGNADVTLPEINCDKWVKIILNSEINNEKQENDKIVGFVGYLSYGADELTNESSEGFFKLYNEPTLESTCEIIDITSLYREYGLEPHGALQSFGGMVGLNKSGNIQYGNQEFNPEKGTLIYNGIERYAIAIGPKLQNPDVNLEAGFHANDMAYGTCVDISVELNNHTYYIPAIIVDCKAHSAPTGIFQTGKAFNDGTKVNTGTEGPIIEWYTPQYMNGDMEKNKSAGLSRFNENSQLFFYRDEVLK